MVTEITDWNGLDDVRNNLSGSYRLMSDLDADTAGYSGIGDSFTPIGSRADPFTGTFNGNGHTISNLVIDGSGTDHVGLFGAIDRALATTDLLIESGERRSTTTDTYEVVRFETDAALIFTTNDTQTFTVRQ